VLASIGNQRTDGLRHETLVVDSGSTDRTKEIAAQHGCRILTITKDEFSFGRSLNIGCQAALGRYLVFISGHCIPNDDSWLRTLLRPLVEGRVSFAYGRQIGGNGSRFSECRIFEKYFPKESRIPQEGFFCNNANSAMPKELWERHRFDEELTGLEDMALGKQLTAQGMKLGYVAEAPVLHLHDESWSRIRTRYEREAFALQHIMPEIQLSFADFLRYFASALLHDCGDALQRKTLSTTFPEILMYRLMQYWGAYRGNHAHRAVSRQRKEHYFYPR